MGNQAVTLNKQQSIAYRVAVEFKKDMLVTGSAGTGKSVLLREIQKGITESGRNCIVVAPTGLAAINVGGATIHRQFHVPIDSLYSTPRGSDKVIKATDCVIIDEIGNCRSDVYEYMMGVINNASEYRVKNNMAPIQVIMFGDFLQLPPVITEKESAELRSRYGSDFSSGAYAFSTRAWKDRDWIYAELTQVMRQEDEQFVNNLWALRYGNLDSLNYFVTHSAQSEIKNAVTLYGVNKKAKEKNEEELEKLDGEQVVYYSHTWGTVSNGDKKNDDEVALKIGARVMAIVNDSEERYYNGSFGTVTTLREDSVEVAFDNGKIADIPYFSWAVTKYAEKNGKVKVEKIGEFTQIPLKLAYAITIHKSQGQTYDAVNIDPYCWEAGQLYTALSRVRDCKNMYFINHVDSRYLKASPEAVKFYNDTYERLRQHPQVVR